jgi:hypothetical protein
VDKTRYHAAFKKLKSILHLKPTGTLQDKRSALLQQVSEFKESFKDEPRLVEYFEEHWLKKLGALQR